MFATRPHPNSLVGVKFSRSAFVSLLLFGLAVGAQGQTEQAAARVAVLNFGETTTGRLTSEKLSTALTLESAVSLIDHDLARAAARGVGYSGSLNLTVQEARDLGAAIGCDFYLLGDAQTLRRSSSSGGAYFESYASIFLVSARSGRLISWDRPSFEAASPEEAGKLLLSQISNAETRRRYLAALRRAQEEERSQRQIAVERNIPVIEEAPGEVEEKSGLRMPRPYRRLRPAYPDTAARADAEGVNATLNVWPVVPHAWQLACSFLPEGRRSLARTAAFLQGAAQRAASGKTIFASL